MRTRTSEKKRQRELYRVRSEERLGLKPGDYERMLARQGGACAICGSPPGKHRLAIDHNHETGKVRGLLCIRCNTALGSLRDDETLLHRALAYLKEHSWPS
jgi:hypothetical protein